MLLFLLFSAISGAGFALVVEGRSLPHLGHSSPFAVSFM